MNIPKLISDLRLNNLKKRLKFLETHRDDLDGEQLNDIEKLKKLIDEKV